MEVTVPHHAIPQEGQHHLPGEEDPSNPRRDGGKGVLDASNYNLLEQRCMAVVRCPARPGRQVAPLDDLVG